MAYKAKRTEHSGAKRGSGAYWRPKQDAKSESNRRRREVDKSESRRVDHSPKDAGLFSGTWRIIETEVWATHDLDLLGPAHISFDRDGLGQIQVVAITGSIDYRLVARGDATLLEISWSGFDDSDPSSGRGWGQLDADGLLRGRLFIHQGDASDFVAKRRR